MATKKAAPAAETASEDSLVDIAEELFKDDKIDTDWAAGNLYVRISRIIESLPDLKPKGENKHFNYSYITDKQVLGALRPRLSRARIVIIPHTVEELDNQTLTTAKGGTSYMSRILVTWLVIDGIDGITSFTMQSLGYGDDSGDKGANKAFTAAFKNVLLKLFEIGGDTDDLEADEEADKRAKARESGARQVDRAVIGDVQIEGVERGGKAANATEAQVSRVGQYVRDLAMTPQAFAAFITKSGGKLSIADKSEKPWDEVRAFLESLSGEEIGLVIGRMDDLLNAVDAQEKSESADDGSTPYA